MHRIRFRNVALLPLLFVIHSHPATPRLELDPASFEVRLTDEHPQFFIGFADGPPADTRGRFEAELVSPSDDVISRAKGEFALDPSSDRLRIEFPIESRKLTGGEDYRRLLWYRLRYRIEASFGSGSQTDLNGVAFLHDAITDLFEVHLTAAPRVRPGALYQVWVRASEPLSGLPRQGISIRGSIGPEEGESSGSVAARAFTGPNGLALLKFEVPNSMDESMGDSWAEIQVIAEKGTFSQSVDANVDIENGVQVFVQTDKAIYQPGQILRSRTLIFDSDRRSVVGLPVSFTVRDPRYSVVTRRFGTTSEHGIATFDWEMPENLRHGDYSIEIESEGLSIRGGNGTAVHVSRYELPEFSVRVKTDRAYYLPGQEPRVEVSANYLFGEPVPKGNVKIVREKRRSWNYRKQKWTIDEAEEIKGVADENGYFSTDLDVDALRDSSHRARRVSTVYTRDLRYTAYFTDSSTGRTEHRRFAVRLTNEEIHVRPVDFAERPGSPIRFYLKTEYADGEPAQCDVLFGPRESKHRTRISTNRHGLAEVSLPLIAAGSSSEFTFEATDGQGRSGRHVEKLYRFSKPAIRLETSRSLHSAGQPIEVAVHYPGKGPVVLYVANGGKVLITKRLELVDGSTKLRVPYQRGIRGEVILLAVAAYFTEYRPPFDSRHVLYPLDDVLDVRFDKLYDSYAPGEKLEIGISTSDPDGSPRKAVLGAVITDAAVEERAETKRRRRYWASPQGIAGYRIGDLLGIDDSERTDPELDLLAEVLLRKRVGYRPFVAERGRSFNLDPAKVFSEYFSRQFSSAQVQRALLSYSQSHGGFPADDDQLVEALETAGIDPLALQDPWGSPYYRSFGREARRFDQIHYKHRAADRGLAEGPILKTSRDVVHIHFRSPGPDRRTGTSDDIDASRHSGLVSTGRRWLGTPPTQGSNASNAPAQGGVTGVVRDTMGGSIPGASVRIDSAAGTSFFLGHTNDDGSYTVYGLPTGEYNLTFYMSGFRLNRIFKVFVSDSLFTVVDATLRVGTLTETVTVSSEASSLPLSGSGIAAALGNLDGGPSPSLRLRQFFPETLRWEPSLETDEQGRARLRVPLADSITEWSVQVTASTADGRIGTARTSLRAFQAFFLANDPPPFLTQGDEVALPVVLRNYGEAAQEVRVRLPNQDWFSHLEEPLKVARVEPDESRPLRFAIRADQPQEQARVRMTAESSQAADAVEKKIRVRPDAERVINSKSRFFVGSAEFAMAIPDSALSLGARAELKLYPDALSHFLDSLEGILMRPYGCAEQTISSTMPSLIVLRYLDHEPDGQAALKATAERYLRMGYQRLLPFQEEDGGFAYFPGGDADIALTAYAVRFLSLASDFVVVDLDVVESALEWLTSKQADGGYWSRYKDGNDLRKLTLTATVSRALSSAYRRGTRAESADINVGNAGAPVSRALEFLTSSNGRPSTYRLAMKAMAESNWGRADEAEDTLRELHSLRRDGKLGSFWDDDASTPFHGWGLAGRIETTALALEALLHVPNAGGRSAWEKSVQGGLAFVLGRKDQFGVWFSTRATANVLEALVAADEQIGKRSSSTSFKVLIDGQAVARKRLNPEVPGDSPWTLDLSERLSQGAGTIRIELDDPQARLTAQLVTSYYRPWTNRASRISGKGLDFSVDFDRTTLKLGETVTCTVRADRTDHRGSGMLLAEIGLPPGAEVDGSSLEQARIDSPLYRFDVLPDRVVAYLWPRKSDSSFRFRLRPRLPMKAKSAPSTLYDYYNPEARLTLAPKRFVVESEDQSMR